MMRYLAVALGTLLHSANAMYDTASSKVERLTPSNFQKKVLESDEIWLVEFYAPWCGHCKQLEPEWDKAARILKGVVKVGAVDMDAFPDVGAPYQISGFPTIKYFGFNKRKTPEDYQSGRTADAIVAYAMNKVRQAVEHRVGGGKGSSGSSSQGQQQQQRPSGGSGGGSKGDHVIGLNQGNFDDLVLRSKDIWIVEFYAPWCGHCKNLEPEYKEAAAQLKGTVKLGKVDATVEEALGSRFGIQGFPTMMVFDYGLGKSDQKAYKYEGGRTAADIISFGQDLAEKADIEPEVYELYRQTIFDRNCEGTVICILGFFPNIYDSNAAERKEYIDTMLKVAKKNRKSPFRYFWLQAGDQLDLERSLNLGFGFPAVVSYSPTKKMAGTMRGSFSRQNLDDYLGDLLIGKANFFALPTGIKVKKAEKWDGEDAPPLEDDSAVYDEL